MTGSLFIMAGRDRLADYKNVKLFGAVGDGVTDDTVAIQAAVNWTSGANRGTIYFPYGSYLLTAPITYNYSGNLSIRFLGEVGSSVSGNFNGYLFDRHLASPSNTTGGRVFERLVMSNGHATGGCIRMGSTLGGAIKDCQLGGYTGITTEDSVGVSSQNINISNCQFSLGGGQVSGSNQIIIGGGGTIECCGMIGSETGVRAYGAGLHCAGNRQERNNTAWLLGLDSGGNNVGLSGFSIMSSTFEGNWTGIDLAGTCNGFCIGSHLMQGHDSSNAGVTSGIQGTQYSIRVRADCGKNGVISGLSIASWHEVASIAIASGTARNNLVVRNNTITANGGGGVGWSTPGNAYTALFENNNTQPIWTYAQLPSGGNVLEGDEFNISDSNTATWGATAAGSGSNRVRVRYNGTNWTVVGK